MKGPETRQPKIDEFGKETEESVRAVPGYTRSGVVMDINYQQCMCVSACSTQTAH